MFTDDGFYATHFWLCVKIIQVKIGKGKKQPWPIPIYKPVKVFFETDQIIIRTENNEVFEFQELPPDVIPAKDYLDGLDTDELRDWIQYAGRS